MMKIKEGFVVREVAGSIVAVATGEAAKAFSGMITLNETGRFLFERMITNTSKEKLVKDVCAEFDVSKDVARDAVTVFCDKLGQVGILE